MHCWHEESLSNMYSRVSYRCLLWGALKCHLTLMVTLPLQLVSPMRVILLQLELWDTGERALNKFDHILPTCKQSTDGVMFFFSYIDRCVCVCVRVLSRILNLRGILKPCLVAGSWACSRKFGIYIGPLRLFLV